MIDHPRGDRQPENIGALQRRTVQAKESQAGAGIFQGDGMGGQPPSFCVQIPGAAQGAFVLACHGL